MVVLRMGSACITGTCGKWVCQCDQEQSNVVSSKRVPVKLPGRTMGCGKYCPATASLGCSKLRRRKKQKSSVGY